MQLLDGRVLWWSDEYRMFVAWYYIDDLRWWYDHLEVMPGWIVVKARIIL